MTEREPRRLVHDGGAARFAGTFLLSYAFYLVLGDPLDPFDLVTGAVTAGVVAAALSRTVFEEPPVAARTAARLARAVLFLPYLLWQIALANLEVALVVLRPSLPVRPALVEVETPVESRFAQAVLSNAISLTPGSVTVEVREDHLLVHTLTVGSRESLEAGGLARAVRFVFHGREP